MKKFGCPVKQMEIKISKCGHFYSIPPSQIDYINNIIFITLNCIFNGLCRETWMGETKPLLLSLV